jgi:hypothetical protein
MLRVRRGSDGQMGSRSDGREIGRCYIDRKAERRDDKQTRKRGDESQIGKKGEEGT